MTKKTAAKKVELTKEQKAWQHTERELRKHIDHMTATINNLEAYQKSQRELIETRTNERDTFHRYWGEEQKKTASHKAEIEKLADRIGDLCSAINKVAQVAAIVPMDASREDLQRGLGMVEGMLSTATPLSYVDHLGKFTKGGPVNINGEPCHARDAVAYQAGGLTGKIFK